MTTGFALAEFEQLSRDVFDEQQVFDLLKAKGYKPEWIWFDEENNEPYGIRVEINGVMVKGWIEQICNVQGWNIEVDNLHSVSSD